MQIDHLPPQPQCAACADAVLRHERVFALISNADSTAYHGRTRPFPFPQPGMVPTFVDDRLLCRRPGCYRCARSPEFVTVHWDCYHVYKQLSGLGEDEALAQLWMVGAWRSPWPKSPPISLATRAVNRRALAKMAEAGSISCWLSKLPAELLHMIMDLSPHQLLWRSTSAAFAHLLRQDIEQQSSERPLDAIMSWERGGSPVLVSASQVAPPVVRLTIDLGGICKVERLHQWPQYDGNTTQALAYIVEHAKDLAGVGAEFRDRHLLRLRLPREDRPVPRICNTATPPDPTACTLSPELNTRWRRIHVIEPSRTHGLTFLFLSGELLAIHAHQSQDSCAADTCERFANRRRRNLVWVYLPLAPKDRVVVLGSRQTNLGFNVLIRTRLVGDVIMGPLGRRMEQDRLLGNGDGMTLVYGDSQHEAQPISTLGSFGGPAEAGKPLSFPLQDFVPTPKGAYFSWAPLRDVQAIQTFFDEDVELCRGILLHYENGGSRVLGQCRLHVDCSRTSVRPSYICYRPTTYLTALRKWKRIGVQVEIGGAHDHVGDEWTCLTLGSGVLTFTFTSDSWFMSPGGAELTSM